LVECKLKRLGLAARAGDATLFAELALAVDKAYQQLSRSVENLATKTPEFAHIPTDRPLLAMVVSAEPIYGGDAFLVERHGASLSGGHLRNVPVAAVSARELEALVTHGADVEGILLEILQSHTAGTAFSHQHVRGDSKRPNCILENAWSSYPFPVPEQGDSD
jgi:hypothetical protein